MRFSRLFFKTFKEAPAEPEILSHILLEKAGYIKKLDRGLFSLSPLMWRVVSKLLIVIREELDKEGLQEIQMPFLQPRKIWDQSGRWEAYTSEKLLYHLQDREQRELCLGPTHEEAVTQFVTNWLTSYKQLPVNIYQVSQKFRDEIRPRFGLMRAKEFMMKDAYAFCANEEQMDAEYNKVRKAYQRILDRLGLKYVIVGADGGSIGKGRSEEFQVLAQSGEDELMVCGDLAYNVEKAAAQLDPFEYPAQQEQMELKDTPNVRSIDDLVNFSGIDIHFTIKTLIYKLVFSDKEELVALCIRGDRQLNEVKVKNFFQCLACELVDEEQIESVLKAKPGSLGPYQLKLPCYADFSCRPIVNFSCGANLNDKHYFNVNWERDCPKVTFHDFLLAQQADLCPEKPGERYEVYRGIEVGHIFNLGTKYSESMEAHFLDPQGKKKPFQMGCYGMGVTRLIQACIEQSGDDKGLVWPGEIAPYKASIMCAGKDPDQEAAALAFYEKCQQEGIEVLYDDRNERMGFKIKDSDLLGIPIKVIFGKSFSEEGKVEVEFRKGTKDYYTLDQAIESIKR